MVKQSCLPRKPVLSSGNTLVEILDDYGEPLAVLPLESAVEQGLRHASVSVLFFDSKKRLLLSRRTDSIQKTWDFPAQGPVWADEAQEDAALRLLHEELRISHARVIACPLVFQQGSSLFSIFKAGSAYENPQPTANKEYLFVDMDELAALAAEFSEMLSKQLLRVIRQYLLPGAFEAVPE